MSSQKELFMGLSELLLVGSVVQTAVADSVRMEGRSHPPKSATLQKDICMFIFGRWFNKNANKLTFISSILIREVFNQLELSYYLESSLIELESSPIELESSVIYPMHLESLLIEFMKSSI